MLQRTVEIIRGLVSSKVRDLLVEANRPQPSGASQASLITDLETYSGALVDFMRSDDTGETNLTAFAALDALTKGAPQLGELDDYFEQGAGKGSSMHKFIRRLRAIADSQLPIIQDAPQQ